MRFLTSGLCVALALSSNSAVRAAATPPTYHLAATWKLAGEGGWDYLTNDSKTHRLYISRGTRIQIVDTDSGALVGEVTGVTGAHGVALDPSTHLAYATSGRTNSVLVFDTQTLKAVGEPIAVGERPDAIVFEPVTKRVFAFNAGSNDVSIIDAATAKVVATTPLGSNPEFGAADGAGHMWVNIEGTSEIAEINALDGKLMGRFPLAPGEEPTGLSYDAKNGLLFAGCANKMMEVVDAKTGKVVASLPVGEGVDATAFDAKNGLAFSSNGRDGTISVIGQNGLALAVLNTVPSHVGARTMTLDPQTGALYVVAADYEKAAPAAPGERPRRPRPVPGSTVVMKFETGLAAPTTAVKAAPTP